MVATVVFVSTEQPMALSIAVGSACCAQLRSMFRRR
jgi:hypothetical protein